MPYLDVKKKVDQVRLFLLYKCGFELKKREREREGEREKVQSQAGKKFKNLASKKDFERKEK